MVRRNVNGAVGRARSILHCEGFRVLKWKRIVEVKKKCRRGREHARLRTEENGVV